MPEYFFAQCRAEALGPYPAYLIVFENIVSVGKHFPNVFSECDLGPGLGGDQFFCRAVRPRDLGHIMAVFDKQGIYVVL